MDPIKEALTFDDVTLAPKYSSVLPSEVNTSVKLSKNLNLKIPLLSSAMDTVTESKMAIEIAKAGGIGVIHRNLSINDQILEIKKVQKKGLVVGAAVGTNDTELSRAEKIIKCKVDLIVVDTAHGHTKRVANIIKFINTIHSVNFSSFIIFGSNSRFWSIPMKQRNFICIFGITNFKYIEITISIVSYSGYFSLINLILDESSNKDDGFLTECIE